MGGQRPGSAMDVRKIGDALPSPRRQFRRTAKPSLKPMPSSLPPCFSEVWRRRQSTQPFDRRQRASLEAVASTIPEEARGLTGEPAAAVYLAALVISLQRLISTTKAVRSIGDTDADKPLSKKARKKRRRQEREAEAAVKELAAADVLGSKKSSSNGNVPMSLDNDDVDDGSADENEDTDSDIELIASLVSLIGMAVNGTSGAVLNTKSELVLETVMKAHDHVFGNSAVTRLTSSVFAAVLSMLDSMPWSNPVIQRSYLYLLRQTSDPDSRSRRRARDALTALLNSPRASIVRPKTSSAASAHFVSELKLQSDALDEAVNGDTVLEGSTNPVTFIYLLTSVERYAVFLMPQDAAKVSKELILIAAKGLRSITPFAFMALSAIFRHTLDDGASDRGAKGDAIFLPQKDLGKLLRALLKLEVSKDSSQDSQVAFSTCVADGATAYASSFSFSPPPLEYILPPVKILCNAISPSAGRTDVSKNACSNLRSLLRQQWFRCRPEVLSVLQSFIGNGYRVLWPDTIPVLKAYLGTDIACGKVQMTERVQRLVKVLLSTREKGLKANDRRTQEMATGILSAIVRGGGAAHILNACEVQYDKKLHVTNAWVLPIFRENLCGAPLGLFTSQLLPVAEELKRARNLTVTEKRLVESRNIGIYISQIWSLLPGFCNKPSDLAQRGVLTSAFKSIHYCLSEEDQPSMYPIGVAALRQLSLSFVFLDTEDPTTKEKRDSFGSRLKKLFPVIISVSEVTSDDKRGMLLEAVTKACQATGDPSFVSSLLRKCIRRLLELQLQRTKEEKSDTMVDEDDNAVRKQHSIADLAIAVVESGIVPNDAEEPAFLEKAMSPFFLDSAQSSLQKKAYKATTLLVDIGTVSKSADELSSFSTRIAEGCTSVAPGAKASRQGLIAALVNQNLNLNGSEERMNFLRLLSKLFLSEVILATRDTSDKTRSAAFLSLITIARGWNSACKGTDMTGLREFFMAVAAGLGGKTVTMLSATLTSLGRLIYEFRGEASINVEFASEMDSLFASKATEGCADADMADDTQEGGDDSNEDLVQPGPVAILLRHNTFEVQKAALGVVKIATKALSQPPTRLVSILPGILPGLVHVAARSKKQETRLRVRVILERLLRKCGRDVLEANFPQDHLKLLSAVRKKYSRDLVKKHAAKDRKRESIQARDEKEKLFGERADEEEEDDIGIDDSDSDIEREFIDGDEIISSARGPRARGKPGSLLVKEGESDVLDLLDTKNSHSVLTHSDVKEATENARFEQKRKRRHQRDDVIKYTDDGKPIFVESDGESGEVELGSMNDEDDSDSDGDVKRNSSGLERKRTRNDGRGPDRHSKKMKGSFGEEYKGRKGLGDVKRAGRPDPYAYIPLGANMLGANPRSGSSGGRKGRQTSSLHRLKAMKGSKKNRPVGVAGK